MVFQATTILEGKQSHTHENVETCANHVKRVCVRERKSERENPTRTSTKFRVAVGWGWVDYLNCFPHVDSSVLGCFVEVAGVMKACDKCDTMRQSQCWIPYRSTKNYEMIGFFGADRHYLKQSLGAHSVGVGVLVLSVDVEQL